MDWMRCRLGHVAMALEPMDPMEPMEPGAVLCEELCSEVPEAEIEDIKKAMALWKMA